MKSKEQVLEENKLAQNNTWNKSTVDKMHYAMGEYAKEVAIEFANWTKQSKYCVNSMEEWVSYDSYEKPTTEQLFEQFKQENNIK